MCPINYALTASANLLQQFIIAKVPEDASEPTFLLSRWNAFSKRVNRLRRSRSTNAIGYSLFVEETKTYLQETSGAHFSRCVIGDLCSTPSANPGYTDHKLVLVAGPEEDEGPKED